VINRSKQIGMAKKTILALVIACACVSVRVAEAQQPAKILRIGYLTANSSSVELPRIDAFRQALRALGNIEGQNLAIEYRHTDGKFEQLSDVAAELVNLNVDVLVAGTTNAALAARKATRTIPIFFIGVSDPIEAGLVDSLARPGGNITGLTNIAPVLSGKRLELLKRFQSSPVLRCCGIRRIQAPFHNGKKVNSQQSNSACDSIRCA
jgi:putative ABC transport system substrate-binding protein